MGPGFHKLGFRFAVLPYGRSPDPELLGTWIINGPGYLGSIVDLEGLGCLCHRLDEPPRGEIHVANHFPNVHVAPEVTCWRQSPTELLDVGHQSCTQLLALDGLGVDAEAEFLPEQG